MPRKSLRSSSTTYRRRKLTWDDTESCTVNHDEESSTNISKLERTNVKKTRGRLVTPSPKTISASDGVDTNESKQKRATRGKQLFKKKRTLRTSAKTTNSRNKESRRRSSRKGSLKEKDATKVLASKRKSIRYKERNFSAGDSLATFLSSKTASKGCDSSVITASSLSNLRKQLRRRRIDTTASDEETESMRMPQTSSPPTTVTTQEGDLDSVETEGEQSKQRNKKNKPVPTELVSLLTASARKRGRRRIRARSTLEILDEFKKHREVESRKARRSLPRACKSSTKSILDEDTDEESEFEGDNKNDGDWTDDNTPTNDSSDKKNASVQHIFPPRTNLRLRPRKGLASSASNKAKRLSQLASPPLINDACEYKRGGDNASEQQGQYNNIKQTIPAPRKEDDVDNIHANKKISHLGSDEKESTDSRRKSRRRLIRYNANVAPSNLMNEKPSTHKSSISSVSRKRSRRGRPPTYEDSPTQLVSLSNGDSRAHESSTRARQRSTTSPRRKMEQPLHTRRQSEQEGSLSGKRVRFDSSTTTFSVKIKIKTNLDSSRQGRNGNEYGQPVPYSPSLDESTVQAIANQVTQACLTQARAGSGRSNSSVVRTCGDSVVNVDVDVNENDESSASFNSNESSATDEKVDDTKQDYELLQGEHEEQHAHMGDSRAEENSLLNKDFDDWRSVTSELTSDWNRPKPPIFNGHNNFFEKRRQQQVFPWSRRGNDREDESASNAMKPPPAVHKSPRYGEKRSMTRRQRMRSSGDSLAGSCFGSVVSATEGNANKKVPGEVSLRKSSPKSPRNNFQRSVRSTEKTGNKAKSPERSSRKEVESERILPIAPTPSRKCLGDGRCGSCKGCRRTFDCQTCSTCLGKLHSFGSASMKEGMGMCLARRCQRTSRIGFADSLLGTDSSVNQPHSNDTRKTAQNEMDAIAHDGQDAQETASKTMKAPWEEGDDWTVDYSYLSEPEYRRNWSKNFKPSSSTRSLSTPSWRPQARRRQLNGGAGRSSLSSVSGSIISQQKKSKIMAPPLPIPNNPQQTGRGRKGGKRKRDPLHGVALPRTSTDACSVTSWRENRKCLRALMEYDEADQDWV